MTTGDIIFLVCIIWFAAVLFRVSFSEWIEAEGFEFVNLIYLYKGGNLNWFGAFFVALIWNILFAPFAIIYWFYKLCTVGRR